MPTYGCHQNSRQFLPFQKDSKEGNNNEKVHDLFSKFSCCNFHVNHNYGTTYSTHMHIIAINDIWFPRLLATWRLRYIMVVSQRTTA